MLISISPSRDKRSVASRISNWEICNRSRNVTTDWLELRRIDADSILCLDWEFVTSVFKIRKIHEFYEIFKIRRNSFHRLITKFSNSHNTKSRLKFIWVNRWMGTVGSDDRGLRFGHSGRQWRCRLIRRLCNRLLIIMLNCWCVNETWTVDIRELLIQTLSFGFATKCLLELGDDECDNLNLMNSVIKFVKKIREF